MESDILVDESRQLRSEEKKADLEYVQLLEDFKRTFETTSGKRVYRHLLERCHVFQTTFTGNSRTFFLEGERNIGLHLLSMREMANPESIEKLKEELSK